MPGPPLSGAAPASSLPHHSSHGAPEPRVESLASGAVITLSGELDAFDAPELRRAFETVLETEPAARRARSHGVTFLDSTVLGAIVGLLRRVREAGGELRTVLPETTARRIFEITNLVAALDVSPSREEATRGPLGGQALAHADDGARAPRIRPR